MEISIVDVVNLVLWLLVVGFLLYWGPSYLREKGRNLATLEDIANITGEVEQVRSEFAAEQERLKSALVADNERLKSTLAADLERLRSGLNADVERAKSTFAADIERLKAELQRSQRVLQQLFDLELESYKEIYAAVVDVREATVAIRPVLDQGMPAEEEARRKVRDERLRQANQASNAFVLAVDKRKPFYPLPVFERLDALVSVVRLELIDVTSIDGPLRGEYWRAHRQNLDEIVNACEAACEAIRSRLDELRRVSAGGESGTVR